MGLLDLLKRQKVERKGPPKPAVVLRELPSPRPAELAPPPKPPTSTELRQQLFDAIATGNDVRLTELCHKHRDFIREYAPTWMIVPDGLRANPAAAEWYTRGLEQLARLSAAS